MALGLPEVVNLSYTSLSPPIVGDFLIIIPAKCVFRGSEILIRTSSNATINVGEELKLEPNATIPKIDGGFDKNMEGVKFAVGNTTVEAPTDSLKPDVRIVIKPG